MKAKPPRRIGICGEEGSPDSSGISVTHAVPRADVRAADEDAAPPVRAARSGSTNRQQRTTSAELTIAT
jgi:hypothetical protein